jgi:putative hydrolase of the HAD superfamily
MMITRDWQGIIFDLDDTLYPERDYVLSGFKAVAAWAEANLGVPSLDGFSALRRLFDEKVRGNTFQLWLQELGVRDTDGLVARLVEIYRDHNPLLVPFPEVPGILRELGSRYRLGLLSDGYLGVQQRKLAALGLGRYFHAVVFSDSWGRESWKPSQKPFNEVANLLALKPSKIVHVADNPLKDFLGAREVGMFTVRLRRRDSEYGYCDPPSERHAPHVTINSLKKLSRLLLPENAKVI